MENSQILFGMPLVLLALSGCFYNDATTLPPGKYEKSTSSTDANGTTMNKDSTTRVYYDENGNKKATVDRKTSTDPKGLFNKNTTQTRETIE